MKQTKEKKTEKDVWYCSENLETRLIFILNIFYLIIMCKQFYETSKTAARLSKLVFSTVNLKALKLEVG